MTQYRFPTISSGLDSDAELLRLMLPTYVLKDNSTSATSDTTISSDPELLLEDLVANGIYEITFFVKFAGDNDGDIQTNWTLPTGASGTRLCLGPGSTASNVNGDNIALRMGVHGVGTDVNYSCTRDSGSLSTWCLETAIITLGANDGDINFAWSQDVSFATATQVTADSWGRARRLL